MVLHRIGGGVDEHVQELAGKLRAKARILILKVGRDSEFALSSMDEISQGEITFEMRKTADLAALIRSFGAHRLHVHHVVGFQDKIEDLLTQVGLPYDLTIHDYMLVCPRIFLYRDGLGYCGEPEQSECQRCLSENPPALAGDISAWRLWGRTLMEGAERVICPTRDVAHRIARYAPRARLVVAPHEGSPRLAQRKIRIPGLLQAETMRIGVLGLISEHKGAGFLLDCISAFHRHRMNCRVIVIGRLSAEFAKREAASFERIEQTGRYRRSELRGLIAAADPHLIFFPRGCPETYSYTLSEALGADLPVVVPDLGCYRERVEKQEWCWVYDADSTPDDLAELMQRIRIDHIERATPPQPTLSDERSCYSPGAVDKLDHELFYETEYLTHARPEL